MLATLTLANGEWWMAAAGLFVLAAAVAVAANRRMWRALGGLGVACAALKLAGFLLLALALLQPQWVSERAKKGENAVAVLVDTGRGLGAVDAGGRPRSAALARVLEEAEAGPGEGWLAELRDGFDVRLFGFGDRLEARDSLAGVTFDRPASNLGSALRSAAARFRHPPMAAVLVFTDGNATDLGGDGAMEELLAGAGLPPVFPVVVGDGEPAPDLAVVGAAVSQTQFEDAPTTVAVDVVRLGSAAGAGGATVWAEDEEGTRVAEEAVTFGGDGRATARLRFRPVGLGVSFFRVGTDAAGGEATVANNVRWVAVDRGGRAFRVLYVSGRPNWEFKFLRRALEPDVEVALVGLIRVAKREPKFVWRGRDGESSNPLFRGFGQGAEDDTAYDQPVLVRLNTRDEFELRDGFPREAEGLFEYHAVIVDDLEAGFFTPDQQDLVRQFVARRGGGFLMLGGAESFAFGGYRRTPVGEVLPVFMEDAGDGLVNAVPHPDERFALSLTREGMLEPWVRLRAEEPAENARLADMPAFWSVNPTGRPKPGAGVLATAGTEDALVTQRFGRGRSAALAVGDFWRWGMQTPELRDDMEKAWRQLVRWLVADVPGRVEVATAPATAGGSGIVRLRAEVAAPDFIPTAEADVAFVVTGPDGEESRLVGEPESGEPGTFTSVFRMDEAGGYHVRAHATGYDAAPVGESAAGVVFNPDADEFARLTPDRARLTALAEATGGEVLALDDVAAWADGLPDLGAPITEAVALDLWHLPAVFIIGIFFLLAEWWLRRGRGYA